MRKAPKPRKQQEVKMSDMSPEDMERALASMGDRLAEATKLGALKDQRVQELEQELAKLREENDSQALGILALNTTMNDMAARAAELEKLAAESDALSKQMVEKYAEAVASAQTAMKDAQEALSDKEPPPPNAVVNILRPILRMFRSI